MLPGQTPGSNQNDALMEVIEPPVRANSISGNDDAIAPMMNLIA
jgi:hypothetical protein